MPKENNQLETIKYILEHSPFPKSLDVHPWAQSLVAKDSVDNHHGTGEKSPGQMLVIAIGDLFIQMMPSTPPRRGKRLDTRWAEFGLLAAQYFAPIFFGKPIPASLREAWGRIDESILLFIQGKTNQTPSKEEIHKYQLVRDELEAAPTSTLSDWNRNGLQHLLAMILARENFLSGSLHKAPVISHDEDVNEPSSEADEKSQKKGISGNKSTVRSRIPCIGFLLLGSIILGIILFAGFKARRIYDLAIVVRQDATRIQNLVRGSDPFLERVTSIGSPLESLAQDYQALKVEVKPLLWLTPRLDWMPVYGTDLASAQDLISLVDHLLASAQGLNQSIGPLITEMDNSGFNPARLIEYLSQNQTKFVEIQQQMNLAREARSHLDMENLSPRVRDLILNDVDPLITMMQDGLTVATELPRLLGATSEGPKTYLLLVQNEDELRPTGGFITAVGTLLVQDGLISNLSFEDSSDLENWNMPYPAAPWQLRQYMNSPVMILGDSSWYTDYPTSALFAETLFSYAKSHSVNGVIAFDQQMLVEVLGVTGPINVEGEPAPVDASNVIAFMRAEKTPSAEDLTNPGWSNKAFMIKIANALVGKIFSGEIQPERLAAILLQILNEHHLLIKVDNPLVTNLLERFRMDGAVNTGDGDFLMVVDSNIGFNKTNAVVTSSIYYEIDLREPSTPTSNLVLLHTNNSGAIICKHWDKIRAPGEYNYPITDCYWNYMRIYLPAGARLLEATPQFIPANWMILHQNVPAQVDNLHDEGIEGVQAFGTLQVIPGGQTMETTFRFALPAGVLENQAGTSQYRYHLIVQKQPGTLAVPLTIRVIPPVNAIVQAIPPGASNQVDGIVIQTDLRIDREFEIVFQIP